MPFRRHQIADAAIRDDAIVREDPLGVESCRDGLICVSQLPQPATDAVNINWTSRQRPEHISASRGQNRIVKISPHPTQIDRNNIKQRMAAMTFLATISYTSSTTNKTLHTAMECED